MGITGECFANKDIMFSNRAERDGKFNADIDNISTIYANLNKTRAGLKKKSQALMSVEGAAEFNSRGTEECLRQCCQQH